MPLELSLVQKLAVWAMPILFALTLPEMVRAHVAHRLGDNSGKAAGRLSKNPLDYVDPIGTVLLPGLMIALGMFVIGWPKPTPIDPRSFRHPMRDLAVTSGAMPLTNLVMAIVWAVVLKIALGNSSDAPDAWFALRVTAEIGLNINLVFMLLSLLPLPPLPGGHVAMALLPPRAAYQLAQVERWSFLILMGLLATGILGLLLMGPMTLLRNLILAVLGL